MANNASNLHMNFWDLVDAVDERRRRMEFLRSSQPEHLRKKITNEDRQALIMNFARSDHLCRQG